MSVRLVAVLLFACLPNAYCHGRLTKPLPRFGPGSNSGQDNGPVRSHVSEDFVCRHSEKQPGNTNPDVPITAGEDLTLQWDFSAAHVGDCAVYLSYDTTLGRAEQKYFKIANLFRCREQNRQDVTITIPDFVPPGKAVLRWDWYALHQAPGVEFYSQCVDVDITSSSTATISQFTTYSIISPPVYPANGREGVGYRVPFNRASPQYMTGPACAGKYKGNSCELTEKGTTGYTGGGGEDIDSSKMGSTQPPGATEPPPGVVPGVPSLCEVYVVKQGDTLWKIAAEYAKQGKIVTANEICRANGKLTPPPGTCDIIDVGDDYVIPYQGSPCYSAGQDPNAVTTTDQAPNAAATTTAAKGNPGVAGQIAGGKMMATFPTTVFTGFVLMLLRQQMIY